MSSSGLFTELLHQQPVDKAEDAPMTTPREPLADPVGVLCDRLQAAMDALDEPWPLLPVYWDRLDSLLTGLLDDNGDPRTDDPAALLVARVVLGEDVTR